MAGMNLTRPRFALALTAGLATAMMSFPACAAGPTSVADLAAPLLTAVVTIATSQTVTAQRSVAPTPQLPDGSPLQDFFNNFFDQQGTNSQPKRVESLGSGFIIDPSGIIVTNNHVIDGADQIVANFTDGSMATAKVVGIDDKTDLAVLKVDVGHPLPSVPFGDSAAMRVGDWVLAVGNPFGFGGTVTLGIVSAQNRDINSGPYDSFIQTDASINKGNSGGPLFNMSGQVIGINTAIVSPSGGSIGIGFAIPSEIAVGVIDQLRQYGEARRGYLGVRVQPVTPEVAQGLGMTTVRGALVGGLDDPGPAATGGLLPGDVILSFNGKDVDAVHSLPLMVADVAVDTVVPVVILRDGKEQTLMVKLGELQDTTQVAATPPLSTASPSPSLPAVPSAPSAPSAPSTPAPTLGVVAPLGLTLSDLSQSVRDRLGLSAAITKGVAVVAVQQGSAADQTRIQAGDVIIQVEQEDVTTAADVGKKLDALKKQGRTTAQLVVQNKDGSVRFVNVTIQ